MTGTCRCATCEEGENVAFCSAGTEGGRERWRDGERRGMFTEAEPEEQTESTTCSFPTLLFAACPHTRVNKQLIETPNTPLFPSRPRFFSSFVYKPSAVRSKRSERAMLNVLFSCSDRENELTSQKDNAGKILFHSVNNCSEKADVIISTKGHKHVSLHSRK